MHDVRRNAVNQNAVQCPAKAREDNTNMQTIIWRATHAHMVAMGHTVAVTSAAERILR